MLIYIIISSLLFFYLLIYIILISGIRKLNKVDNEVNHSVSIIVPFKNEEDTIANCIQALLTQNYPVDLFEVICVDDHSTDNSFKKIEKFKYNTQLTILRIINNNNNNSSKKIALMKAISKAKGDILLFTDGDCVPHANWTRSIIKYFESDVGIVTGFSPWIDKSNSLLGTLIEFDSLAAAAIAASGIGIKKPITCTGRNFAYRKEVYDEVNGFSDILHSVSGDDDLFLQLVHKKTNWKIKYNISQDSIVLSYQTKSFKEFFIQKKRHISAGKYYSIPLQIMYGIIHITNIAIYLFILFSIFYSNHLFAAFNFFLIKNIVQFYFIYKGAKQLKYCKILKYYLLWDIYYTIYNLIVGPYAMFGKIRWKE